MFKEVVQCMSEIHGELLALRSDMENMLMLIIHSHSHRKFYKGIDIIDAHHSVFMEGLDNLERTNKSFQTVEVTFRASFKKHFQVEFPQDPGVIIWWLECIVQTLHFALNIKS